MVMKARISPLFILCGVLAGAGLSARAIEANVGVQANATVNPLPAGAAPAFSGGIDDVVKLAHSGVDETVVLSYIKNSPGPFSPSADEIIKLRDAGISPPEISAMLERGAELRVQATAAQSYAQPSAQQAPVITEQAPANYADTSNGGYSYDNSQPGSTVVYAGGDNSGYPYYGGGYPYYGSAYWWGYPSTFFCGGFISTPFFFPFPCWFNGCFFPHGCSFPHGGFIHGGFHGSFHDANGFHSGFHGTTGFHGGFASSGFHGSSFSGFHGGTVSGFRGGSASGFRGGFAGGGFHGSTAMGGGFHGPMMGGGGFRGSMGGGGFHGSMGGGGFHGSMGGGGFHGSMGGGGFHGGGGGGGGGGHR